MSSQGVVRLFSEDDGVPFTSRRIRWLIAGAGAVLLVTVVAPYVYIHAIQGPAPPPLRVATLPTVTGAAPPATVDGVYAVAPGSQAGYRIGEVLFGQSATAVGRTSAITGTLTIAGATVSAADFTVDMTQVRSDQSQRDGQFQGRIMNTAAYPTATFALTEPIQMGTLPADGTTVTETATGKLTLHGTTRSVTFPVTAKRSGTSFAASGSIPITFADFGIRNPSGGPATTQDHGTLEFALVLSHR